MTVFLSILVVLAALAGLAVLGARREMRRLRRAKTRVPFDKLDSRLQPLLHRVQPGAVLAAHPNGRDGFLQLALTGREGDWREVELGLPDADWSRRSFDRAVEALPELACAWEVEHNPGNPDVPRFLRVWVDGDEAAVRERAAALLHRATEVLGLPPGQTYNVDFRGSDHPEFIRETADLVERNPETPGFVLRLLRWYRRHADEVEREMEARLAGDRR